MPLWRLLSRPTPPQPGGNWETWNWEIEIPKSFERLSTSAVGGRFRSVKRRCSVERRVRAVVQAASEGCGGGVRAWGALHCGGLENGKKKHEISHYKLMRNFMFFFAVFKSPRNPGRTELAHPLIAPLWRLLSCPTPPQPEKLRTRNWEIEKLRTWNWETEKLRNWDPWNWEIKQLSYWTIGQLRNCAIEWLSD